MLFCFDLMILIVLCSDLMLWIVSCSDLVAWTFCVLIPCSELFCGLIFLLCSLAWNRFAPWFCLLILRSNLGLWIVLCYEIAPCKVPCSDNVSRFVFHSGFPALKAFLLWFCELTSILLWSCSLNGFVLLMFHGTDWPLTFPCWDRAWATGPSGAPASRKTAWSTRPTPARKGPPWGSADLFQRSFLQCHGQLNRVDHS